MDAKFAVVVLFFALSLVHIQGCAGAPRPSNKELLEKSIAEYLRHDAELVRELQQMGFDDKPTLERAKRQSEFDESSNDTDVGEESKPGFFDRAAKFVVELLQRFLKWINTDGN